jgi:hypothetical protein
VVSFTTRPLYPQGKSHHCSWFRFLLEKLSHSTSQEILSLLWNPKFHYHIHDSLPIPRGCATFRNKLILYGEDLVSPRRTVIAPVEDTNAHAREKVRTMTPLISISDLFLQYISSNNAILGHQTPDSRSYVTLKDLEFQRKLSKCDV